MTEWLKKVRRERRALARVRRAAWRLEQAERERDWALAAARHEKVSVRKVADGAELSPTRVHGPAVRQQLAGVIKDLVKLPLGLASADRPKRQVRTTAEVAALVGIGERTITRPGRSATRGRHPSAGRA
ncbi:hypothetical protein ACWGQ5_35445 [Streptomyces sp. NPDC055722]